VLRVISVSSVKQKNMIKNGFNHYITHNCLIPRDAEKNVNSEQSKEESKPKRDDVEF